MNSAPEPHAPIVVPNKEDCAPRRPSRLPRWLPPILPPRPPIAVPRYSSPAIRIAAVGHGVRVPFNYRNAHTTTAAAMSVKAGSIQYTEGPHERRFRKHLEARGDVLRLQLQVAAVSWTTPEGLRRKRILDVGRQEDTGRIVLSEVKAHWSFFEEPELADDLLVVEDILRSREVLLERVVGEDYADRFDERRVNTILSHRRTTFGQSHVDRAIDAISRDGGAAPLGRVREAVDPDPRVAARIVDAMQVHSRICFPIDRPITADTPVRATRRPPAGSRTLRDIAQEAHP